jgi:hypothetical protein
MKKAVFQKKRGRGKRVLRENGVEDSGVLGKEGTREAGYTKSGVLEKSVWSRALFRKGERGGGRAFGKFNKQGDIKR